MLFSTQMGKSANEGELCTKFFKLYDQIKQLGNVNIGWELVKSQYFPSSHLVKFSSNTDSKHFKRIYFLNKL